jgi:hypothetical protein
MSRASVILIAFSSSPYACIVAPPMALYALAIFLSAFLLFQVQPIVGRHLLPWFGGTPAVWTTCLLFFQTLLFAGYLYAHRLSGLSPRRQRRIHSALLLLSVLQIAFFALAFGTPLAPPPGLEPGGSGVPALRILGLLAASVGLPYFALSATAPLLQSWAARLPSPERVWRLYALSNLGSLLALLAYPFVLEPALSLRSQDWAWSALFVFAAVSLVATSRRQATGEPSALPAPLEEGPSPGTADRLLWLALSACGSLLLVATTDQMCQEVAVVPFLWVLPLALYLLSFVLCFELPRFPWRPIASALFVLSLVPLVVVLREAARLRAPLQVAAFSVTLFSACLVCHGELYRLRPKPARLTGFYLTVAAGGALGGGFVAVAAPLLFNGYWEYPLGLLLCGGLLIVVLARSPGTPVAKSYVLRTLALGLWLALAVALAIPVKQSLESSVKTSRGFYGVLRVREELPGDPAWHIRSLTHGRIQHGFQYVGEEKRRQPTTYYGEQSGVGRAIRFHPRREAGLPIRIGGVGLGVGTLAAYVNPGDVLRFYEINPDVVALSRGPDPAFSFLADAPGKVDVVEGDARLSLEREISGEEPGRYDVLALDAFSSDAVPVHLLTAEAISVYLLHLRDDDSILAVHASNRHVRLQPVLLAAARKFGLSAVEIDANPAGHADTRSVWVLMSRRAAALAQPGIAEAAVPLTDHGRSVSLWTDDRSSLLPAVVW